MPSGRGIFRRSFVPLGPVSDNLRLARRIVDERHLRDRQHERLPVLFDDRYVELATIDVFLREPSSAPRLRASADTLLRRRPSVHDRVVVYAERCVLPKGFHDPDASFVRLAVRELRRGMPLGRRDPVLPHPALGQDLLRAQGDRFAAGTGKRDRCAFEDRWHEPDELTAAVQRLDQVEDAGRLPFPQPLERKLEVQVHLQRARFPVQLFECLADLPDLHEGIPFIGTGVGA